ncbi:MAG: hypothetical protein FJ100_14120 [Deltaproteobacteria bacterium]|nr:hypothetical protein [Deltaproteobacteria bacterium]
MLQATLVWTAPRLDTGDFSPEDPLAIDYIGQQIGNRLWPGFTSRTSRAGYYAMVCYGVRVAEELAARQSVAPDDEVRRGIFERWEKLWALAICASFGGKLPRGDAVRGQRGVERAFAANQGAPRLNYKLLERQLQVGALGAYLTSLAAVRQDYRIARRCIDVAVARWFERHGPEVLRRPLARPSGPAGAELAFVSALHCGTGQIQGQAQRQDRIRSCGAVGRRKLPPADF